MTDTKKYKLKPEEIQQLIPQMGGCMATDKITEDGELVNYMYREEPDFKDDSGWRFLSGAETQEYADNPSNWEIYDTNTIANYDRAIIPYLKSPIDSELERIKGTEKFR
ncbi:DUF2185 domain-containing protein [Sunxiuqinia elliptica]|uniref:Immunity protein Imm33 domain-containing protein n=1 Tax=Sunxiuqinia elliptica TaxID=655355 RepID=A0A4R6GUF0_9BACT|nr:DUF2185 domain-containing protein [Sunxiuqinia elliptica]TDN98314.1 hypothetical protein DET52_108101 [Sunxiuqinia elliptica]TDO60420.1 hypothetical protein DET65_2224 [Sunxiuqinia elliptica]